MLGNSGSGSITLQFTKLTTSVCRVSVVGDNNAEIALPEDIRVRDNTNQVDVAPFQNGFLLAWSDEYTIFFRNVEGLSVCGQRQWSFDSVSEDMMFWMKEITP